jgi:2'-5' RNA ligase
MRMFVAIDLDDTIKQFAVALRPPVRQLLGAAFRFVNPQQLHLTLVFMADAPPERVVPALDAPIDMPPFDLAVGGLGVFPPRGAPRVLWLGLTEGAREVIAVQKIVAGRLRSLGVALEDREFHPHLTLGRWRQSRPSLRPSLPADSKAIGRMTVDHVTLYESRLSSEGPTHIALARARLEPLEPLEPWNQ